jgi:hypothetical protein
MAEFTASSNLEKLSESESPHGNGELVLDIDDEATIRRTIRKDRTLVPFVPAQDGFQR